MDILKKKLKLFQKKIFAAVIGLTAINVLLSFFGIYYANYFLEFIAYSSDKVKITLFVSFLFAAVFFIVKSLRFILFIRNRYDYLALCLQKNNPSTKDNLINALQLEKKVPAGTSVQLASEFIDVTDKQVSSLNINFKLPFNVAPAYLILFAVVSCVFLFTFDYSSVKKYFMPFGAPVKLSVVPGDVSVVIGESVDVIFVSEGINTKPELFFRPDKGEWTGIRMRKLDMGKFTARLEKITEDTKYFIRFGDGRTQRYGITVVAPTSVAVAQVKYEYPAYTGLSDKTTSDPDIEAPAGTVVAITGISNRPLKEAYLMTDTNERIGMAVNKDKISCRVALINQTEYRIEAVSIDGYGVADPVKYRIRIIRNEPPEIIIIHPACDVVVSEKGRLKIIYSATDAFGIRSIDFNCLSKERKINIAKFPRPVTKSVSEYELMIRDLSLVPGDVVRYRLEATDADPVSGGTGVSEEYIIEVFSYELEHEKIEQSLAELNQKFLEMLAKQMEAKDYLLKGDKDKSLQAEKDVDAMASEQIKNFDKILERMMDDPLASASSYADYESIKESMDYLQKDKIKPALERLSGKDPAASSGLQEEIIAELERISILGENVYERQKMEDAVSSARDMRDASLDLKEQLESAKEAPSPEKLKKLNEAAEKLSGLMKELVERLLKMPKNLPDEFVNASSVKKIDFAKMGNTADALKQALADGNIDEAIKIAEQLAKQIAGMLKNMDDAAQTVSGNSNDALQSETTEAIVELDKIIKRQQDLLNETMALAQKYKDKILELQKDLIKELYEKQKIAVSDFSSANSQSAGDFKEKIFSRHTGVNAKMMDVLNELRSEKVENSRSVLPQIITEMNGMIDAARVFIGTDAVSANSIESRITDLLISARNLEAEILDLVNNFSPSHKQIYSQSELDAMDAQSGEQGEINKTAEKLSKTLSELSLKTPMVNQPLMENVAASRKAMSNAAVNLSAKESVPAAENEKEALENLLKAKDSLSSASEQMEKMSSGSRPSGSSGAVKMRSGSADGGSSGISKGFVKIPSVDEYTPPAKIKEEIMNALRKKYPSKYENVIKEYYKSLIE
ncbi:MAG: hypothetical protein BWY26_00403 [Elusimicrobia bacterium ADurb.Bin231]|nr:MAG: hypothetical protein BWY26_00403 [Elusimicrobia bacterium ADurb.Bin231]